MPPDPLLLPIIDAMNSARFGAETASLVDAGSPAPAAALADEPPEIERIVDEQVAVAGGSITVRIYTPFGAAPFPAHLYFHGGGFWLGTLEHADAKCRETASGAGCVVASVAYRLAPQHKFPTAPEDCFAALEWLVDNAARLGVDARRISVGGVSSGANLAAVVALMARDRGGPALAFQVLEAPVTDLTLSFPSMIEHGAGYVLTKDACARNARLYLTDPAQATHPYASPYFAEDLSGLPPALIATAEFDPVRDEGEAFARRLEVAGVPVTAIRMQGHIHGSMAFTRLMPSARDLRRVVHEQLREAYRLAG